METEFLPCQDDPSPTNKPLNGSFDDLDIPYIDEEEEEDAITSWWRINSCDKTRLALCKMKTADFFFMDILTFVSFFFLETSAFTYI